MHAMMKQAVGNQMTRCSLIAVAGAGLPALGGTSRKISPEDDHFLDDLSRRTFQYFWEYTDPDTGMTPGRAKADGVPYDPNRRDIARIAVTGFRLAGLSTCAHPGGSNQD